MRNRVLLIVIFALAMGYLEATVVVYLRDLYYPEGFDFPLRQIGLRHSLVELGREAATIIMLLAVAYIAEKTARGRLASFLLLFGTWDITYYVVLRATLSWPASLLTWDILFLIPLVWSGPVLAPVLVSVLLIITALIYYYRQESAERIAISRIEWTAAISGGGLIFLSFVLNHGLVYGGGVPVRFPWEVYAAGMAAAIVAMTRVAKRIISGA